MSHNSNGSFAKPSRVPRWTAFVFALFAGLVTVDVANVLLIVAMGDDGSGANNAVAAAAQEDNVENFGVVHKKKGGTAFDV